MIDPMAHVITLWSLQENAEAVIRGLADSIPDRYRRRLRDLGFHVDERIVCVKRTFAGGPRLYRIGNCVYSLEKKIANAIEVKKEAL